MARFLLGALILGGCSAAAEGPGEVRTVVVRLTSDEFEGREAGSRGERRAAEYVLGLLRAAGARTELQVFAGGVNAVGVVPGRLEDAVVIGAHVDHLGMRDGAIHRGADDNASGVAALVRIAGRFGARPARRTIVLVAFGAEEKGILGSREFVKSYGGRIVAMLNLDMVGRLTERKLICIGTDTSEAWESILHDANTGGLRLTFAKGGVGPSDHTSFYQAGVPVVHFFTGAHRDYHTPGDTPDKLDYEGIEAVADFVEAVARHAADRESPPGFRRSSVELETEAGPEAGAMPYLGAMPDYAFPDRMQVADVAPGSPAERAGIRAGDVIAAVDGDRVADLEDYSKKLFRRRPGARVKLRVRREGFELDAEAVLGAKERRTPAPAK